MDDRFKISLGAVADDKAEVVFAANGFAFKLSRLVGVLPFVAKLEQLRRAVIAGGGRESWFDLLDEACNEFVLEVSCAARMVSVNLWRRLDAFQGEVRCEFACDCSIAEFDYAVKKLHLLR
ncbi:MULTISPECIES: hypothetical protein [Pedobacter]|uniref:hypothetical protein n=1 Tax=Pedobacter TaxID=84567 RepID=UPI002108FA2C|nr:MULTISPECIES: hypothetical protein [unclassified Pedobacter]